jgi:hypothetical protein
MSSTGPTVLAGPPSVIAQLSLESEAFRITTLSPLVPVPHRPAAPHGAADGHMPGRSCGLSCKRRGAVT